MCVVCVCVTDWVHARSWFSAQYRLVSLSISFFLSVPTMHTLSIKTEGGNGNRERKTEREKEKPRESARPLDKSGSKYLVVCQGNRTTETAEDTKGDGMVVQRKDEQQRCTQRQKDRMLNPVIHK